MARAGRLDRLPARRRASACGRDPARGGHRQARAFVLPPLGEHRLPAGDRLGVQPRDPQEHLQPRTADLRPRLDDVLHPLGRGRLAPLDADARGAGDRLTPAAHVGPAFAAGRRLPDRPVDPLLPGLREPRHPGSDRRLGSALPARRDQDGRARPDGGKNRVARAHAAGCRRRARRRGRLRADVRRGDRRCTAAPGR